jgi:hypothetical protein
MDPRWNEVEPAASQNEEGKWAETRDTSMQRPRDEGRVVETDERNEDNENSAETDVRNKDGGADREAKGVNTEASSIQGQDR